MTKPPITHFADLAFCHSNLSILYYYNFTQLNNKSLFSCRHYHYSLAQVLFKIFLLLSQLNLLFFLFHYLFLLRNRHQPVAALDYDSALLFNLLLDLDVSFKLFFRLELLLLFLLALCVFYLFN